MIRIIRSRLFLAFVLVGLIAQALVLEPGAAHASTYRNVVAQVPAHPLDNQPVTVWVNSDTAYGETAALQYNIGSTYTVVRCSYDNTDYPGADWQCPIPGEPAGTTVRYQLFTYNESNSDYGYTGFNWSYTVGSGNINWDGLFADQSPFFMSPVNPSVSGSLTLRFRALHGDLTSANVNWYDSANPNNGWNNWIPMSVVGQDATGKYDIWEAKASALLASSSTKFYRFQANQANATTWYNADGPTCGSGSQTSCQAPDSSNFWVIPNYTAPSWTPNAIFYQIFPDRFRDGNTSNDLAYYAGDTVNPDANGNCPAGSYEYGGTCAFTHSSWNQLPTQPGLGADFFGGDLAGINQEIGPYLKGTLGVNALYLNPIFESPSNHKYDTQDYFKVDPHFGTNTGSDQNSLTTLIGNAHGSDMKVMLDGVFNHTGDWNCWFNRPDNNCGSDPGAFQSASSQYRTWYKFLPGFDPTSAPNNYCSWSGFGSLPQLNYSNQAVRDEIYASPDSVMQTYLKQYGIDGWRLDVADNYSDLDSAPSDNPCQIGVDNHQIWENIDPNVRGANPNALILGEYWNKPTDWLGGYEANAHDSTGTPEWDSVMNYNGFNEPVSQFFTGLEVHADSSTQLSPSDLANWFTGTLADNNRQAQLAMLNSLSTHDTSRFLYRACLSTGGSDSACRSTSTIPTAAYDKLIMATELQMTYVGMPSIYYGDEIGMTGGNDPDNRRPFDWNQNDWNMNVFNATRTLVANRNAHEALRDGAFKVLLTDNSNDVFAFGRFNLNPTTFAPSDAAITIVNNGSGSSPAETLDASQLSLTNGTVLTDVMTGNTYTVTNGKITITLPADTGAVLVMGSPATVAPQQNFPSDSPIDTTTTVSSQPPAPIANNAATYTATVSAASGGTPAGTVQFAIDGTNVGSPVTLTNGQASYDDSSVTAGSHTISATYIPGPGSTDHGSTGSLSLDVATPPSITSAGTATWTYGQSSRFTITTTPGIPSSTSIDETGSLPAGLTFMDNGDGTATISGTPQPGSEGNYSLTITADNGKASSQQDFTLTVQPAQAQLFLPASTTVTYDGSPQGVSATTSPSGLAGVTVTYTGTGSTSYSTSTSAPTHAGTYQVDASLTNPDYQAAGELGTLTITPRSLNLQVAPLAAVAQGQQVTLSATISGVGPVVGLPITFTLGSQTCTTGVTNSSGVATCQLTVNQALGPQSLAASFAGDGDNNPVSASADGQTIVYAAPTASAFVIGDRSAAIGATVTFWGSTWSAQNSLSGGIAPTSFKGFASNITGTTSGTWSWNSTTGNSSNPPATVPSYMGVLVSSSVTQNGNIINGNVVHLVVVQTNPGYGPDPTQAGTGTVVAQVN